MRWWEDGIEGRVFIFSCKNSKITTRCWTTIEGECWIPPKKIYPTFKGKEASARWLRQVTQSCLTLCDPVDCSPPGSSVRGILQARILEWVAIPFSRGSSQPRDRSQVSHIAGRRFNLWATRESQQDGRRGELAFRIKPHTHPRCLEGSNKTLCALGDSTETEPDLPLSLWLSPVEEWVSSGLPQG